MSSTQQGSSNLGRAINIKAERGTRRTWSPQEEAILILGLKELVANGWKSDNGFRAGYLTRLQDAMKKEFPATDLKGMPHINSKLGSRKKNYSSLTLILSRSGVGFNGMHMIDCDDQQWEQIVKVDSNARSIKGRPWPMFQYWQEIFGKDRATGDSAEDVIDAVNDLMSKDNPEEDGKEESNHHRNAEDISQDDIDENSICSDKGKGETAKKTSGKGKGKKRRANEDVTTMVEVFREIGRDTNARLEKVASRIGYEYDLDEAKKDSYNQLEKIPGLDLAQKFEVCDIFIDKPDRLTIFKGLPEDDKPAYVQYLLGKK